MMMINKTFSKRLNECYRTMMLTESSQNYVVYQFNVLTRKNKRYSMSGVY